MVKNERRSQRRTRQNNTTIPCRIQRNRPKPRRIHVLYIGPFIEVFEKKTYKQCRKGKGPNIEKLVPQFYGPCKLGGPFIEVIEKKTYKQCKKGKGPSKEKLGIQFQQAMQAGQALHRGFRKENLQAMQEGQGP